MGTVLAERSVESGNGKTVGINRQHGPDMRMCAMRERMPI
jgi:hypothetical protein